MRHALATTVPVLADRDAEESIHHDLVMTDLDNEIEQEIRRGGYSSRNRRVQKVLYPMMFAPPSASPALNTTHAAQIREQFRRRPAGSPAGSQSSGSATSSPPSLRTLPPTPAGLPPVRLPLNLSATGHSPAAAPSPEPTPVSAASSSTAPEAAPALTPRPFGSADPLPAAPSPASAPEVATPALTPIPLCSTDPTPATPPPAPAPARHDPPPSTPLTPATPVDHLPCSTHTNARPTFADRDESPAKHSPGLTSPNSEAPATPEPIPQSTSIWCSHKTETMAQHQQVLAPTLPEPASAGAASATEPAPRACASDRGSVCRVSGMLRWGPCRAPRLDARDLRDIFRFMDTNHCGQVSSPHLPPPPRQSPPPPPFVQATPLSKLQ